MLLVRMVSGVAVDSGADALLDFGSGRAVLVVSMGNGEISLGGELCVFGAGSVLLLDVEVGCSVLSGEVQVGYLVGFESGYLDYFLLQYPLARGLGLFGELVCLSLSSARLALVLTRVRALGGEVERDAGFEHLKLLFSLFLLDVVEDRFVLAEPFDERKRLFAEFKELLESSFRISRSTAFYAKRLGVSQRRMNALCRGWYEGKGLFEVVMDRIISEAEFLLLGTDMPIKAVAYELGFSSGENFGMYFRRMRGISPLVFRVRHVK